MAARLMHLGRGERIGIYSAGVIGPDKNKLYALHAAEVRQGALGADSRLSGPSAIPDPIGGKASAAISR
jgi:hypothetical protein